MWEVEVTDEFEAWWESLARPARVKIDASVALLETLGPRLGRPHVDTVKGSRHSQMKELRVQQAGTPLRIFFAFDPRRNAVLLIGGDKTGDKRFYQRLIPKADRLYDEHLAKLREEKGDG